MPTISATPQSTYGRVLIVINWADTPSVLYARVQRVDSNGTTPVRANTAVSTDSDYMELSGGQAVLYDTEAPMDESFTYITDGEGSSTTATSSAVELDSDGNPWLKSPLHPWQDKQLTLSAGVAADPACLDLDAVYFAAMDAENRPARTSVFPVNQRRAPIPAPRVRGSITSTLRLISRTFAARDQIIQLNASGDPLLFQAPSDYGIPDRYMSVGDYSVVRLSPNHKQTWRVNQLPHVEVDRPAGLASGVLGNRWADMCDTYATFNDAETAGLTWTMAVMGYASDPPTNPEFRLYSDIPLDFATYGDIPTGGRTYQELLEGD